MYECKIRQISSEDVYLATNLVKIETLTLF